MSQNDQSENKKDYVSPGEVARYCGYSLTTLRNWANSGKVRFTRTPGGKRMYYLPDIQHWCGIQEASKDQIDSDIPKRTLLYARVSSSKQKPDLDRQKQFLQDRYPNSELLYDIGSGLNYNRRGLQRLLGEVSSGTVREVVVTYTDRLCRYGLELIEWIFREHSVQLVVLCEEVQTSGGEEEFAKDILDVCNYFVAKYNGKKSGQFRRARKSWQNWGEGKSESQEISDSSRQTDEREGEESSGSHKVPVQPVRTIVVKRIGREGKEGESENSKETVSN